MSRVSDPLPFCIAHEIPGRIRIRLTGRIPYEDASVLETLLLSNLSIISVRVYGRIGSLAISYLGTRDALLSVLESITPVQIASARSQASKTLTIRSLPLWEGTSGLVAAYLFRRFLLPKPLRILFQLRHYASFISDAFDSLRRGKLDVPVLDAAAVGTSLLKRDFNTAGSQMFLLELGEYLENNTRERSRQDLINSLLEVPEHTWLVKGSQEILVDTMELAKGDTIVVRAGSAIPVDGEVLYGHGMVNQVTLTGEPDAIERKRGDAVYAGTTLEIGELFIKVRSAAQDTRVRSIVRLVEQTELHKSENQIRLEKLADKLVPWNFLYALVLGAVTGSLTRAASALMVDYSCALKLIGSITSLAAMREATLKGFTIKNAQALEAFGQADTIVFDKTGTLTVAEPKVIDIIALGSWNRREVLRLSACLEEHFPHSVARAVVKEAERQGINHREHHTAVEYVVAHGIVSTFKDKRVIIGSGHFVFEDEGVPLDSELKERLTTSIGASSALFLAVDHELVGALVIEDPLKPNVPEQLKALKESGFTTFIMLTGDNHAAAKRIATQAGIQEFKADMLPEDKHAYIEELQKAGRKVVMIGDGINDAPALSGASVGIAMGDGAAIAHEVAEITLVGSDLSALVTLRHIGINMIKRMMSSTRFSLAVNTALLALGSSGTITAQMSSAIHNGTTVFLSMKNMSPLVKQEDGRP